MNSNKRFNIVFVIFFIACLLGFVIFGVKLQKKEAESRSFFLQLSYDCVAFLESNGWEIESSPFESSYIALPKVFGEINLQYNELQLSQGFDLLPYAGRTVEKTAYRVLNYPGYENTELVQANIFICDGKIIAADICCVCLDGFMHGVKEYVNGKNQVG